MTTRPPPPTAPREPDAADCCGEGCVNCVFDMYEAQLARYRAALEQWKQDGMESEGGEPGAPDPATP